MRNLEFLSHKHFLPSAILIGIWRLYTKPSIRAALLFLAVLFDLGHAIAATIGKQVAYKGAHTRLLLMNVSLQNAIPDRDEGSQPKPHQD